MSYLIPFHESLMVDPIERRDLIEEQRRVYQEEVGASDDIPDDEEEYDEDLDDDGFGDY